jgi:Glycosyltransferase family 10 (fucosyltransferase) C-term
MKVLTWFVCLVIISLSCTYIELKCYLSEKQRLKDPDSNNLLKTVQSPVPCAPRSAEVERLRSQENRKIIAFYGRSEKLLSFFLDSSHDCLSPYVLLTDENRTQEADMVVIQEWFDSKIPQKYCNQTFMLLTMETPHSHHPEMSDWEKFIFYSQFDYLASHRLDSDVLFPYMHNKPYIETILSRPLHSVADRNKSHPVAWVASHCPTHNRREEYVEQLMGKIGVASYGKCLNNAKLDIAAFENAWENAATDIVSRHKFYLSFENAICDYYVTEKLVRALNAGVIPVIMGAPQARYYVPNENSAIFIDNFESPSKLADYLNQINDNDTLFESFFEYKKNVSLISEKFRDMWLSEKMHQGCQLSKIIENPPLHPTGIKYEHLQCETKYGTWNKKSNTVWNYTLWEMESTLKNIMHKFQNH